MAATISFLKVVAVLVSAPLLCFAHPPGNGGFLYPQFYDRSCPKAQEIVKSVVAQAVAKEARMAASLLRLEFHDCFVKGCDASILLDSSGSINSEKNSNPNRNSARGFEVIDNIKSALEKKCPQTVSCADIMALAARDSTVLAGGPSWEVPLGRRDSRDASLSGSNNNIPAPNNTFQTILTKFKRQGLDIVDLVALSGVTQLEMLGAPATGRGCTTNLATDSQTPRWTNRMLHNYVPTAQDPVATTTYSSWILSPQPNSTTGTSKALAFKGLLSSDQVLFTKNQQSMELVKLYAENNKVFFEQFAKSMIKMGNISPLTGSKGEIRKNCRKINT